MKFLSLALAAVLSVAQAKRTLTNNDIQKKIRSGNYNKKALMSKAVPYNRKLEDGNAANWQITSQYSVRFDECISLKLKDNDLLSESFSGYFEDRELMSEKSYVVFNLCMTEDCMYDVQDGTNSYIVDLPTFVSAMASELPTKKETYCEQCERNEEYCSNKDYYDSLVEEAAAAEGEEAAAEGEEAAAEGEEAAAEGEEGEEAAAEGEEAGGGRRLNAYIDCDKCVAYECFEVQTDDAARNDDANDVEMIQWDDAFDFLDELADCSATEFTMDNRWPLYTGLICNSDGSGVEVGVFLDDECTLYTTAQKYANIMDADDSKYISKATELLEYMFNTDISCQEDQNEYINPYNNGNEVQEEENRDGNYNYLDDIGDWCEELFKGGEFEVQNLANCEAIENDDTNNDDKASVWTTVNWYMWDMDIDDNYEEQKTCYIVQQWGGNYKSHHVYNQKRSGTTFNTTTKTKSHKARNAIIVVVVLLVLGAAAGAYWAFQAKKGDKKRTPLINGATGSMA